MNKANEFNPSNHTNENINLSGNIVLEGEFEQMEKKLDLFGTFSIAFIFFEKEIIYLANKYGLKKEIIYNEYVNWKENK